MERIFLSGFGDVGLERPRDIASVERKTTVDVGVHAELLLDTVEGGVLPQAGCNLSAVLDRKQTEIAEALLEHAVVCLPYLLGGGSEGQPGVGEPRFGEFGVCGVFLAAHLSLGIGDVGADGGAPEGVVGSHDKRIFSV